MADDASLERFLAAAAPLRDGRGFDAPRMLQLLDAVRLDGGDALFPPLDAARKVGLVATATPTARNAAIARYALERVAIAMEGRLGPPAGSGRGPSTDAAFERLRRR